MVGPATPGGPGFAPEGFAPAPDAAERVKAPAIALLVTGILGIVVQLLNLVLLMVGVGMSAVYGGGEEGLQTMVQGPVGMISAVIGAAVGGLIIYGSLQMMKLKNHPLCKATTIVAMIPCVSPCCLLGLPFGIWALVVISKPEIEAAFTK
jgi:hypothetical protein